MQAQSNKKRICLGQSLSKIILGSIYDLSRRTIKRIHFWKAKRTWHHEFVEGDVWERRIYSIKDQRKRFSFSYKSNCRPSQIMVSRELAPCFDGNSPQLLKIWCSLRDMLFHADFMHRRWIVSYFIRSGTEWIATEAYFIEPRRTSQIKKLSG